MSFQRSVIRIVLLCDSIVSKYTQILVSLCKLEAANDSVVIVNHHLKALIDAVVYFRPDFTAASFFLIDKSTLFSIVNCTVTFLIVIVQLKISL
jgi:hypothetical protein